MRAVETLYFDEKTEIPPPLLLNNEQLVCCVSYNKKGQP